MTSAPTDQSLRNGGSGIGITKRLELSIRTKRSATERSEGLCEGIGAIYGLQPGTRYNAALNAGLKFDHYPILASDCGSNGLDNWVAVCRTCHRFKTSKIDLPSIAKGKRISYRSMGIRKPGNGFLTNRMGR